MVLGTGGSVNFIEQATTDHEIEGSKPAAAQYREEIAEKKKFRLN